MCVDVRSQWWERIFYMIAADYININIINIDLPAQAVNCDVCRWWETEVKHATSTLAYVPTQIGGDAHDILRPLLWQPVSARCLYGHYLCYQLRACVLLLPTTMAAVIRNHSVRSSAIGGTCCCYCWPPRFIAQLHTCAVDKSVIEGPKFRDPVNIHIWNTHRNCL